MFKWAIIFAVAGIVTLLVIRIIKVMIKSEKDSKNILVNVLVHKDDIGRVIGKKGRVASSIRTLVYAAAMRYNENVSIEFDGKE